MVSLTALTSNRIDIRKKIPVILVQIRQVISIRVLVGSEMRLFEQHPIVKNLLF